MSIADQISRHRRAKGLNLTELAQLAQISKGYLSQLENRSESICPSADILYRIAFALETTVETLLGKPSTHEPIPLPDGLREFAFHTHLEHEEVQMLARIHYKGEQPKTAEDWWFLYECIKRSTQHNNIWSAERG